MKTTSNLYRGLSLFVVPIVTVSALALPVSAEGAAQSINTGIKQSSECVHIATLQDTNNTAITGKITAMANDFSSRLSGITAREQQVDQKVTTYRTNLVNSFDAKVAKLESNTNLTASQKAAIETYKTSVLTAETTREHAVDAARQTYRTDLSTLVNGRQSALTNAVSTFQSSVATAFTTAANTCTSDTSAVSTLRASIKTARQTMQSTMGENKVESAIQQDAATRKAAVTAADQAFTQAASGYAQTLATALATTSSPSTKATN